MHWVADWVLQTTDMAMNKSKSNYWLTQHVFTYTMSMSPVALVVWAGLGFAYWWVALLWLLFNGGAHWITDYFTSRWTSKLYKEEKFYGFPAFFSVIGLDQLIHFTTLIGSYWVLTLIL
jgi:hypothetical protein